MADNSNYQKLSWRLIFLLIGIMAPIIFSVIGFNYSSDLRRDERIEKLTNSKIDTNMYNRDRTEIIDRLSKIEGKIDILIQSGK